MAVRAVRGATQLEVDEREHLLERTTELVTQVMEANGLTTDDLIVALAGMADAAEDQDDSSNAEADRTGEA